MRYIQTDSGRVTAVVSGTTYSFGNDHPSYDKLVGYLERGNVEYFEAEYSVADKIEQFSEGHISCAKGVLEWEGVEMPELFGDRILNMKKEGHSFDSMLNFLDNLNNNPSDRALVEMFDFLQHKNLPITNDGCFLAYKAVREDFKDIYSGSINNSVGSVCELPRGTVDDNRDVHCSHGLHVGAFDYVDTYGGFNGSDPTSGGGNQIVICKVNPMDVVSVPSDVKFQKMRTCKYEVVALFNDKIEGSVFMVDQPASKKNYDDVWRRAVGDRMRELVSKLSVRVPALAKV